MQLTEIATALSSDPEQMIRGIIRIFHFLGLALGLGAATLLDMMIIRFFLGRPMTKQNFEMFAFFSDLVSVGLKLLWVTGFGFLIFYWAYEPVKLGNEKVWAKMVIVAILSINGYFVHRAVLPFLAGQIGYRMMDGVPLRKQAVFVTCGMISVVSWYAPLIIANLPHLNFQVPMWQILGIYGAALLVIALIAQLVLVGSRVAGQTRLHLARRESF